jgi:hypothetical protein
LQTIAGDVQFGQVRENGEIFEFAQIAFDEGETLELRVGLKQKLCLDGYELDVQGGDSNARCLFTGVLLLEELLYYLCIIRHYNYNSTAKIVSELEGGIF